MVSVQSRHAYVRLFIDEFLPGRVTRGSVVATHPNSTHGTNTVLVRTTFLSKTDGAIFTDGSTDDFRILTLSCSGTRRSTSIDINRHHHTLRLGSTYGTLLSTNHVSLAPMPLAWLNRTQRTPLHLIVVCPPLPHIQICFNRLPPQQTQRAKLARQTEVASTDYPRL